MASQQAERLRVSDFITFHSCSSASLVLPRASEPLDKCILVSSALAQILSANMGLEKLEGMEELIDGPCALWMKRVLDQDAERGGKLFDTLFRLTYKLAGQYESRPMGERSFDDLKFQSLFGCVFELSFFLWTVLPLIKLDSAILSCVRAWWRKEWTRKALVLYLRHMRPY